MIRHVLRLSCVLGSFLWLAASPAAAQTVYRCGDSYSTVPCPQQSQAVPVADARAPVQAQQARQTASSDAALADRMVQERLARERAAALPASVGVKPASPLAAVSKPTPPMTPAVTAVIKPKPPQAYDTRTPSPIKAATPPPFTAQVPATVGVGANSADTSVTRPTSAVKASKVKASKVKTAKKKAAASKTKVRKAKTQKAKQTPSSTPTRPAKPRAGITRLKDRAAVRGTVKQPKKAAAAPAPLDIPRARAN